MQYPVLKFSTNSTFPTNTLKGNYGTPTYQGTLQASTADIQLSQDLNKQKYLYLFQNNFKRNNSNTTSNADDNDFSQNNSLLLFNSLIDNSFINSVDQTMPVPQNIKGTMYSSFGMRNLINPVIPVIINNTNTLINLNSTLGIIKDQGIIPSIKNIKVYRIYKNSYKKIKSLTNSLILLPTDKIEF